jgi:hypothetical protein
LGTIGNPESLLQAAEKLITQAGAEAIAVVARFPDDTESEALQQYRHGSGIDPIAGAEAVISHLIVRTFKIPCAHAPALSPLPLDSQISPRAAAEELGYTFFPCVLVGLSRSPQFIPGRNDPISQPADIWADQVDAVVIPATAAGGSAVLSFSQQRSVKIIAVQENSTQMQVHPEDLGIPAVQVQSYLEALGVLVASRAGIRAESLRPQISPMSCL